MLSSNSLKSGNWRVAGNLKKKFAKLYRPYILEADMKPMTMFSVEVRYRSRLDVDNVTGSLKVFVDELRYLGIVPDDNPKHFPKFSVEYNKEFKTNTIEFTIIEL